MRKSLTEFKALLCILLAGYLFYSLSVSASEVVNSQEVSGVIENSHSQNTISSTAAGDWGLSESEWESYLRLMQGPSGLWYRQLSPAAVLGLNAADESTQHHYAALVAKQEHDKIARELSFNHAVYLEVKRLNPTEPLIKDFDKSPFNPQHSRRHHD